MAYGSIDTSARAEQAEHVVPSSSTQDVQDEAEMPRSTTMRETLRDFYERNLGLLLVFLAQTCGSIMSTAAKLLANDPSIQFHALQIIFIRMICTTILGSLYMWYHNISHFPTGQRGIRKLLVLRGTAGFVGIFGLYYSLSWLDFADATVITFMIPTITALVCFIWLREPFTWKEALCSVIAFSGVLFVARPPWLFQSSPQHSIPQQPGSGAPAVPVSAHQRSVAILFAILGTFGASTAYATIRVIGKRAHSLISVNYFAAIATVGSTIIILVHPDLHFVMPRTLSQWGLVSIIGLFGFLLQFLLTEGLQREKAGRATNLTYLQLVFALVVERVIWGTTPPIESLVGAALIIGAAIWVSLQKNSASAEQKKPEVIDEESNLLGRGDERST